MHILLKLVLARPQLLVDHAQGYAALMTADLADASTALARRVALGVAGLVLLLVATILAGVSLMLWAVVPTAQMGAPWLLIVVPVTPLTASVVVLVFMRWQSQVSPFATLRKQMRADMDMLRESSVP